MCHCMGIISRGIIWIDPVAEAPWNCKKVRHAGENMFSWGTKWNWSYSLKLLVIFSPSDRDGKNASTIHWNSIQANSDVIHIPSALLLPHHSSLTSHCFLWKIGAVSLRQLIVPIILCYEVPDCGHYSIIDSHLSLWALSNFPFVSTLARLYTATDVLRGPSLLLYFMTHMECCPFFWLWMKLKKNARHSTAGRLLWMCACVHFWRRLHSVRGDWFVVVVVVRNDCLFVLARYLIPACLLHANWPK